MTAHTLNQCHRNHFHFLSEGAEEAAANVLIVPLVRRPKRPGQDNDVLALRVCRVEETLSGHVRVFCVAMFHLVCAWAAANLSEIYIYLYIPYILRSLKSAEAFRRCNASLWELCSDAASLNTDVVLSLEAELQLLRSHLQEKNKVHCQVEPPLHWKTLKTETPSHI